MKFKIVLIGWLMTMLSGCKPAMLEPDANNLSCDFAKRVGFVNDYCHFLTAEETTKLEQAIADFHTKTGTEIIIVVEDSKKSHSRKFHCPQAIAKKWQLAAPEQFDDFLIVISRRRTYVDFGYGLKFSQKLTIEEHRKLLYEIVLPLFKKDQYYEGLRQAVAYFMACQTDRSAGATQS